MARGHPGGGESRFLSLTNRIVCKWACACVEDNVSNKSIIPLRDHPSKHWECFRIAINLICTIYQPLCLKFPRIDCVLDSISHRADSHSSRHHWQWSISCSQGLLELSTSLVSCHLVIHNNYCSSDLETSQSQQSALIL